MKFCHASMALRSLPGCLHVLQHSMLPSSPFSYGQVFGSDGADYVLRFYCIVSPTTPAGLLYCCGSSKGITFSFGIQRSNRGTRFGRIPSRVAGASHGSCPLSRRCAVHRDDRSPGCLSHSSRLTDCNGRRYLNNRRPNMQSSPVNTNEPHPIKMPQATAENISAAMIGIGLPVTRIEHRDNGTHNFYGDVKKRRDRFIWINEMAGPVFWLSRRCLRGPFQTCTLTKARRNGGLSS